MENSTQIINKLSIPGSYLMSNCNSKLLFVWIYILSGILFLSACTPTADLYNPKQSSSSVKGAANSTVAESQITTPDWIYSVDASFLVGEGQGSNFEEAKNKAVSNIKKQLARNLSERISYQEGVVISNAIISKSSAFSNEEFNAAHFLESEYPEFLIRFNTANILAHYWINTGRGIQYFIKYAYNQEDLQNDLKRTESYFQNLVRQTDSLCDISNLTNLEDLRMRLKELKLHHNNLPLNSIGLQHKVEIASEMILQVFDNLHFEKIKSEPGLIVFTLASGNVKLSTQFKPLLIGVDQVNIAIKSVNDSEWALVWDPSKVTPTTLTILYDGLETPITEDFRMQSGPVKEKLELPGSSIKFVNLEVIESSWFTEEISKLKVQLIHPYPSNPKVKCVDIILKDNSGFELKISSCSATLKGSSLEATMNVNIPRSYLLRCNKCDITIHLENGEDLNSDNVKIQLQL